MNWVRQHIVFFVVMVTLLLAISVETGMFLEGRRRISAAESAYRTALNELEQFKQRNPAPTEYNLQLVRRDLRQNASVLATMLTSLKAGGSDGSTLFSGAPKSRTDAYFDLATFVEYERQQAAQAGVKLKRDERFGFAAYANEGPDDPLIGIVYRQRKIVGYLLSQLFASGPDALLSVERERYAVPAASKSGAKNLTPQPVPEESRRRNSRAGDTAGDIFTIDPQVSARVPGFVDTLAFRIGFTGQTASLRRFMNRVADSDLPIVVRSVEVEPVEKKNARARSGASDARTSERRKSVPAAGQPASGVPDLKTIEAARVPIVLDNVSRFFVTVEYLEVKIKAPEVRSSGGGNP